MAIDKKHLDEFRREYLERLVNRLRENGTRKPKIEFYFNSKTKPSKFAANLNIEKVTELIEQLKAKGVSISSVDTEKMSTANLTVLYGRCVKWVQDPRNRNLPNHERRSVHNVFSGGSPGDWFGKETPALMAKDTSSGELLFVLPHEVQSSHFSLISKQGFVSRDVIPIFDFLTRLKQNLEKQ